ncbi:hypothetical protein GQ457_01G011500 [Hibiscus cannabinus]
MPMAMAMAPFLPFHFFCSSLPSPCSATATKPLALVEQPPVLLKYHNGPLLKGNITLDLIWYGQFSSSQPSIIVDFLNSLSSATTPSVSSWWHTTDKYHYRRAGSSDVVVGKQILDVNCSLGKALKASQLGALTSKAGQGNGGGVIHVVLTSADVAVDEFCESSCGTHASGRVKNQSSVYAWVGNSVSQCPGYCTWPFHRPLYGPQTPPLVAPNGDVGVDGMVINLATVLAGTVTNPFNNGYFQGSAEAPLRR